MTVNVSNARGRRSGIAFLGIFLFAAQAILVAQEPSLEELPGLRERAVVMHIIARIVEENQQVVWDSENTKITFLGRPVGIKLVGEGLVVSVQFTPYLQSNGRHILVAQAQIWLNIPNEGIRYQTTMQTIPLEFIEQVYFFPLGSLEPKDESRIEIQLALEPYSPPAAEPRQGQQGRRLREPPGGASDGSPGQRSGPERSSPPARKDSANPDNAGGDTGSS